MKTTATKQVKYNPIKQEIFFLENGRLTHGFVGKIASTKFFDACGDKNTDVMIVDRSKDEKTAKIRQFHAILAKKGLLDLKYDIIAQYGVESSKDLTVEQLDEQINALNATETSESVRSERSSVLYLLGKLEINGSKEEGWDMVNNYLKQPRIAGKTLYEMNTQELRDCVKKLRAIIYKKG